MKKEVRTVYYDEELQIEAYRFEGMSRAFPNHFHEYYMIGFIEAGRRTLSCRNMESEVNTGDIVLFHPGENHSCAQLGENPLDYRSLGISPERMKMFVREITGKEYLPGFSQNVILNEVLSGYLRDIHLMIMENSREFVKEEKLLFLLEGLLEQYEKPFSSLAPACETEIEEACRFMEARYQQSMSLDDICKATGLSKSTLLRAFTRTKGVTPYRYLETIRINKAVELLKRGIPPVDAALETGFSDQSHFTKFFTSFTGVSPGAYSRIFMSVDERGELS